MNKKILDNLHTAMLKQDQKQMEHLDKVFEQWGREDFREHAMLINMISKGGNSEQSIDSR